MTEKRSLTPLNRSTTPGMPTMRPDEVVEFTIKLLEKITADWPEVLRDCDVASFVADQLQPTLDDMRAPVSVPTTIRQLFDKVAEAHAGDYASKVDSGLVAVYAFGRRRAALSETKEHTEYLRQLLIGLECNNIDKLLTEKQDPLLFRYLAERITCAAKAGAALGAGIAPEELP